LAVFFFKYFFKQIEMKSNKYAGLGASLGVPQSALESVTSLDPRDYLYPNLDGNGQFNNIEQQLACKGARESMQVLNLQSAGNFASGFFAGSELLGNYSYENTFGDLLGTDDILSLANNLDKPGKAVSEGDSDKSTATLAPQRVSPRRNTATSVLVGTPHETILKFSDEEEEELLVAGNCFNELETEILVKKVEKSGVKRSKRLSLKLDYKSAAKTINNTLDTPHGADIISASKKLKSETVYRNDSCDSSPMNVRLQKLDAY
jgi:hypothetical protein